MQSQFTSAASTVDVAEQNIAVSAELGSLSSPYSSESG